VGDLRKVNEKCYKTQWERRERKVKPGCNLSRVLVWSLAGESNIASLLALLAPLRMETCKCPGGRFL